MELHIILERGVEYNDEYNYLTDDMVGDPIKSFKNMDNALAAMATIEKELRKERQYEFEGDEHPDLLYIKTIQVEDEDVSGYAAQRQSLEAAKKKMKAAASEFFTQKARKVFDRHPKLQGIRVTAYTPHWNDGETCEYGINDPTIKFEGLTGDAGDEDDEEYAYVYSYDGCKHQYPGGAVEAQKEADALISSITKEDFESLFGDHVQVTVTREGTETEEYEHE